MTEWQPNSENEAKFQLVDTSNVAVTGLGSSFMFEICFPGTSVFIDGVGSKLELQKGWYKYISPASESATLGELVASASGAGTAQQNLVYQVGNPQMGFGATSITVNIVVNGTPIDGAEVWMTSDVAGAYLVAGTLTTNSQGNANFWLDSGTYYSWVQHSQYNFTNPTEVTVG